MGKKLVLHEALDSILRCLLSQYWWIISPRLNSAQTVSTNILEAKTRKHWAVSKQYNCIPGQSSRISVGIKKIFSTHQGKSHNVWYQITNYQAHKDVEKTWPIIRSIKNSPELTEMLESADKDIKTIDITVSLLLTHREERFKIISH